MKTRFLILLAMLTLFVAACGALGENTDLANLSSTSGVNEGSAETSPEEDVAPTAAPIVPTNTAEAQATDTAEPEPTATENPQEDTASSEEPADEAAEEPEVDSDLPPAEIVNDEGGPVSITGEVNYTNAFFTDGVAEPVIILEDQAGFVDRNEHFIMPVESQTLGQITSDFFDPPFTYSIALPIEPQGTQRDVDNDDQEEIGVQVYAIAYWTNTFGDPYLEERDLSGGGWSTAYASTLTSPDAETNREIVGGKLLIYSPEVGQGFPSGFGDDGLLFTEDDPLVTVPQGYTIVDLDTDPFTFDRSRHPVIDLIEPETTALVDNSDLSYTEAFDSLIEKMSKEYAFTEYKKVDWDQIHADLRPRFEEADDQQDARLYRQALRDLARSIPDGHVSGPQLVDEFRKNVSGGLGIAVQELDDGRTLVSFLAPESPADKAGIELQAEILAINDQPIEEAISSVEPFSGPFSTEHVKRLNQMRYVTRFPVGTEVSITFRNPDSNSEQTVELTAVSEPTSFSATPLAVNIDGFELPVEYELLEGSPIAYVKIGSFSDNELLTAQLWERMINTLNDQEIPGLIIDMRQNRGGSGFLADALAAYFFDEPHVLGNTGRYDEELDDFFFDDRGEQRFYLPAKELRYDGAVAVLVGPNCNSACEFFSYDMTVADRATIVGQYPTSGLGGSIDTVRMPEGEMFRFTQGRAVDAGGEIHIEGKGVVPTVQVPVNEDTVYASDDPVLQAAIVYLVDLLTPETVDLGSLSLGEEAEGHLETETRAQYTIELSEGDVIDITVSSEEFDPGLLILDVDGNLLLVNDNLDDDTTDAGFLELQIPTDLVLVLQVVGPDSESSGAFKILAAESAG